MSLLIFIIHFSVLILLINTLSFFRKSGLSIIERNAFFLLKVLFGFVLIYVYSRFYPQRNLADVFKYFDDANVIYHNATQNDISLWKIISCIGFDRNSQYANLLLQNTHHFDKQGGGFLESNHLIVIRTNLLLRIISGGSIFIHSLWFSFFSFIGFTGIYQFLKKWFSFKLLFLKLILFCIPSVLFWSSGLLKESLLFLGFGMVLFSFEQIYFREKKVFFVLFFLAALFTWFLKPFVCISLISALLLFVLSRFSKRTFYVAMIAGFALFLNFANDLSNLMLTKRSEFVEVAIENKSGSIIDSELHKEKSFMNLIEITLMSLYAVFFEPFSFQDFSLLQLPFMIESLLLLLSIILMLRYTDFWNADKSLLIFLFLFSLLQIIVIGWSVPIAGAIVRYRVTALPFIWILLLHLFNLNKFKYEINKLYQAIKT